MKRKVLGVFSILLSGIIIGALFAPQSGYAWPWDSKEQKITVEGYAFCTGLFDASLESSGDHAQFMSDAFNPNVEWFKIRGQDDQAIIVGGSPQRYKYRIVVPQGWVVEWFMKCHGDAETRQGSFEVSKSILGTHQTRHICSEQIGFSPCRSKDYAGCVLMLVDGVIQPPAGKTFEESLTRLASAARNGYSPVQDAEACVKAILADVGVARREVPVPPAAPNPAPITQQPQQTFRTIEPLPQPTSSRATPPKPEPTKSKPSSRPPQPPSPPVERTLTIYNKVTNGGSEMREDTPAYLSTVTKNFCRRDGCMIGGTEMGTGATVTGLCWTWGDRTTNGQDNSALDDGNPGRYESTRWYRARHANGSVGYISEVWIDPSQRSGAGLPAC